MINRIDLGTRIAGEKGQKSDEFLTRSQIMPGSRVRFEYDDNYDIRISANGNIDGGFPDSVYLPTQLFDGGGV